MTLLEECIASLGDDIKINDIMDEVAGVYPKIMLDGDMDAARAMLARAAEARGDEKTPEGAVMEGDVLATMHTDATPLAAFTDSWAGVTEPDAAYRTLSDHLASVEARTAAPE